MTTHSTCSAIFSIFSSPYTTTNSKPHQFQTPPIFFNPKRNPRLRVAKKRAVFSKQHYWVPYCCSGNSGINPETTNDLSKESSVNIQLPRRSLLVQFTCNACGEKTKRLVNRLAYERGTVFVQCSGCLQHHKLVDNLGLVVEYNFRNDIDEDQMHT